MPAAGRAESQEACFLAGGDYRSFLERRGLNGEGPIVDEAGRELGRHAGVWRFTPGQRRGLGVSSTAPLYALRTDAATGTLVVGPRESLATTTVAARGRLFVDVDRVEAKLRYRSPAVAATVSQDGGFRLELDQPAFAVAAGQAAVLYEDDAVVGSGLITAPLTPKIASVHVSPFLAISWNDLADLALAVFLFSVGLSLAYAFIRLGGTLGRVSSFIKGTQEELLPVINKTGGTVDRVNAQLDKVDLVTDSAVDAADSVDTAVRAVSFAIQRPVQKVAGLAAGIAHGLAALRVERDVGSAVQRAKEAAARREAELAEELQRVDRERP